MRVLIVRLGAFGDIIHTLPLLSDLYAARHEIDWVCDRSWGVLFEGHPYISKYFTVARKQWKQSSFLNNGMINGLRQLRAAFKARKYDVVIDAQGRNKSAVAAYLSGAQKRISHDSRLAHEGSSWFSHVQVPGIATHVVDQMRALALPLLGEQQQGPWQFTLPAWQAEHEWATHYAEQEQLSDYWIWNVGTTWPTKLWPVEQQKAFIRLLCDEGKQVLVVWGPGWEEERAQELIDYEPRAKMAPATTLPQLAALIKQARIMISCDTGPLHLALALDTPAVGLFGPVPAERNGPRGLGYRNIQAPGLLWERRDVSKVHMHCITPKQVYREALACLEERSIA